jgi:hypothetical protein
LAASSHLFDIGFLGLGFPRFSQLSPETGPDIEGSSWRYLIEAQPTSGKEEDGPTAKKKKL